jgi:hypothetical protein
MIVCTRRFQRAKQTCPNVPTCRRGRRWYLWSVLVMHRTQFHPFNWHNIGRNCLTMHSCCLRVMWLNQVITPCLYELYGDSRWCRTTLSPGNLWQSNVVGVSSGTIAWLPVWLRKERSPGVRKIAMIYSKNLTGKQKRNNGNQFPVATRFLSCKTTHREPQNDPRESLKESCWNLKRWPNW